MVELDDKEIAGRARRDRDGGSNVSFLPRHTPVASSSSPSHSPHGSPRDFALSKILGDEEDALCCWLRQCSIDPAAIPSVIIDIHAAVLSGDEAGELSGPVPEYLFAKARAVVRGYFETHGRALPEPLPDRPTLPRRTPRQCQRDHKRRWDIHIQMLDPFARQVWVLRFRHGRKASEIARALNVPRAEVESALVAASRRWLRILEQPIPSRIRRSTRGAPGNLRTGKAPERS
jgi:hypothetical protein